MARRRTTSRRDERGAVIVEAAIIIPVLFMLVFGALEYGLLFKDDLTGSNVVRASGRALSAQANTATADQTGLQAMIPAAGAFDGGLSKVRRVVVYIATCTDPAAFTSTTTSRCPVGAQPIKSLSQMAGAGAACIPKTKLTGVAGRCNIYAGSQLTEAFANDATKWSCGASTPDRFWCPNTRVVSQTAGTDYIGIHIEYTHSWVTGLFGTQRSMTDTVIFRVEPQG